MYSCDCKYKDEGFYCSSCMEHATNDDPDYQTDECPVCEKTTEIEVDEGLHESCLKIDSAGPYCMHTCDGRKEHQFGCSNNGSWFAGEDIPDDLWTDCGTCATVSNHRHRGNQNCDLDHIRCPNCNILAHEGVYFVQPFHFYLECNSCYISREENNWPYEYYCDCCDGYDGKSEWDEDEKDFYCGNCEKHHEDEETECYYFDEEEGYAHADYDDDDDAIPSIRDALIDDDDSYTESNQHSWINPSIVGSGDNIIGWDDKEIFFQFHCDRYVPPRRRRDDYDGCEESFFVAMRYDSGMHPREYFDFISGLCRLGSMEKSQTPVYRRLGRMPNVKTEKTSESWDPTRGEDFQKGDFKKGDFQKGDFKKS